MAALRGLHGFGIPAEVELHVSGDVVEGDGDEQVGRCRAAEVRVAVGGDDLEDAVVQLEN